MTKAATKARLASHVPVAPMRERFLERQRRDGLTGGEVARKLGWTHGKSKRPDSSRLLRVLGLKVETNGEDLEHKTVTYQNAVKLCRALDMDPVDGGV